jgi:hypothetical protein
MPEEGSRDVAKGDRIAFAFVAALAGWAASVCLACFYFTLMPAIRHLPRYPSSPDGNTIGLIYLLCTLVFVFVMTLVFGAPYVATRTPAGMLQRRWRFYLETGLAGIAAITGYLVLYRPEAETLGDTLRFGLPLYGGFSLATTIVTRFVFLRWLRFAQRKRVDEFGR